MFLTSTPVEHYAVNFPIGVVAADVIVALANGSKSKPNARITPSCSKPEVLTYPAGTRAARDVLQAADGLTRSISFEPIPAGDYRLRVGRRTAQGQLRDAVTMPLAVLDAKLLSEAAK